MSKLLDSLQQVDKSKTRWKKPFLSSNATSTCVKRLSCWFHLYRTPVISGGLIFLLGSIIFVVAHHQPDTAFSPAKESAFVADKVVEHADKVAEAKVESADAVATEEATNVDSMGDMIQKSIDEGKYREALALVVSMDTESLQEDENIHRWLAKIYSGLGQNKEALRVMESLHPSFANHSSYYAFMAYLSLNQGSYRKAIELYQQLVSSNRENAAWWMGLAIAYQATDNNEQAVNAYQQVMENAPDNAPYLAFVTQQLASLQPAVL